MGLGVPAKSGFGYSTLSGTVSAARATVASARAERRMIWRYMGVRVGFRRAAGDRNSHEFRAKTIPFVAVAVNDFAAASGLGTSHQTLKSSGLKVSSFFAAMAWFTPR